ncbi:MAG: antibiotic biosynthesis monooxygenase [Burkholderiales bacterium]|nr:antibiotic biosynthesis monooxygenase [Burkholderiales bacterium]
MPQIAIIIDFEPHPEKREEFLRQLRHDARVTLRDDGCLRMEVLHPCDGSGRIVLSELWRDEDAIAAHRNRPGHSHAWQEPLLRAKRVLKCLTD